MATKIGINGFGRIGRSFENDRLVVVGLGWFGLVWLVGWLVGWLVVGLGFLLVSLFVCFFGCLVVVLVVYFLRSFVHRRVFVFFFRIDRFFLDRSQAWSSRPFAIRTSLVPSWTWWVSLICPSHLTTLGPPVDTPEIHGAERFLLSTPELVMICTPGWLGYLGDDGMTCFFFASYIREF